MTTYQDYLIVLSPPESIVSCGKRLKNFSAGIIGEYDSQFSQANITIQRWPRKKPVWIEPLLLNLERELRALSPIILDINGFDFFDRQDYRTIYAKLNSTLLTEVWFKYLRRCFGTSHFEPHITITRTIPLEAFNKLWPHFKNRTWNEQFKVDKLTILRRETIGHDKSFKVIKEIPFNKRLDFYAFANSKLKVPPLPLSNINSQQISLF